MRGIVFDCKLKLSDSLPVPEPKSGEALVRVSLAGICNTDLEIIRGYMGFMGIIGHEFVGVVESEGSYKGRRVVGEINCACGECAWCAGGMPTHCPSREVLGIFRRNGCMADYLTLPVANLHPVPDNLTDEEAVFAEPLAAAFEILEQVEICGGESICVLGDGKLGLLCALVLHRAGAEVTLVGRHADKLAIAKAQGVRVTLSAEHKPEGLYDFVVEATGTAEGFQEALKLVRPRGAVILKSTVAEGARLNLAPVVINELTVIGSRCGPFVPALKALSERSIDVRPMVSAVYPVSEAEEAFKKAREKGVLKVLLDFRGASG